MKRDTFERPARDSHLDTPLIRADTALTEVARTPRYRWVALNLMAEAPLFGALRNLVLKSRGARVVRNIYKSAKTRRVKGT